MPRRPPRACAVPGCPAVVEGGARCPDHVRALRREADSLRPTAARRGYDASWRRVRLAHLKRQPLCVECERFGVAAPATDVDHVVPLRRGGTHAASNLQSLCHFHHSRKTAAEDGAFGRQPARSSR